MVQTLHSLSRFSGFSQRMVLLAGIWLAIHQSVGDVEIDLDRNESPEFHLQERESHETFQLGGGGFPIVPMTHDQWWAQLTSIAGRGGSIAAKRPPPGVREEVAGFPSGHLPNDADDDLVWFQQTGELLRFRLYHPIPPPNPPSFIMSGNFLSEEIRYAALRLLRNSEWYYGWLALRAGQPVGQIELVAFDISESPDRRLPMGEIQFETEERENGLEIRWNPQISEALLEIATDLSSPTWTTYPPDEPGRVTIPRTVGSPIYFRLRYG